MPGAIPDGVATDEGGPPSDVGAVHHEEIVDAVSKVRRETAEAIVVSGVVDTAVATLLVNATFRVVKLPAWSSVSPGFPPRADPAVSVHVGVPFALTMSLLAGVVECLILMRVLVAEQFEEASPSVVEALWAVRNLVADGGNSNRNSHVSVALHDDVPVRLRELSSVELSPIRRIIGALLTTLLLSAGNIQVAISDIQFEGPAGKTTPSGDLPDVSNDETWFQSGSSILGDPKDMAAGSEQLNATITRAGDSGDGDRPELTAAAYDSTGYDGDNTVGNQCTDYPVGDTLKEADLIRDYTLEIRENRDE